MFAIFLEQGKLVSFDLREMTHELHKMIVSGDYVEKRIAKYTVDLVVIVMLIFVIFLPLRSKIKESLIMLKFFVDGV